MVTGERPDSWRIESTRFHGPNLVSCKIVTWPTRTPLVGAYLPLSMMEHLLDIEEALQLFKGWDTIVLGDLNVELYNAWVLQSQRMADLLTEFSLIYLI